MVASCVTPSGYLACNPGMCPDWELNQQPFGSQASTQSTEQHQPGLSLQFLGLPLLLLAPYDLDVGTFKVVSEVPKPLLIFFKDFVYLFIFRERGREGERGGVKHQCVFDSHPLLGTWPATQVCALTGNQTTDPLLCRLALNPLSYICQGTANFII